MNPWNRGWIVAAIPGRGCRHHRSGYGIAGELKIDILLSETHGMSEDIRIPPLSSPGYGDTPGTPRSDSGRWIIAGVSQSS